MNVLELFSGTGSIGKVCRKLGWDSVSLDLDERADIVCDILEWDYKVYPKDYFSIVWASCPCVNYSRLKDCNLGRMVRGEIYTTERRDEDMKKDDKLVIKTLEIINYFDPDVWFIENPAGSRMKDRPFMIDIDNYIVDYCMYSDWGYQKRTRIFTNKKDFSALLCNKNCGNIKDGRHLLTCDNGYDKRGIGKYNKGTTKLDRYRIPEDLILSLFLDH